MPRARLVAVLLAAGAVAVAAGWMVSAQPNAPTEAPPAAGEPAGPASPPGVPIIEAPPEPSSPPVIVPPSDNSSAPEESAATNEAAPAKAAALAPPPAPVLPVRSPAAVLQVLDKVTAETMRFAAPVGQHVRYKNLVFTVKACETSGLGQPSPEASAYLLVDSRPLPIEGRAPAPGKQVFRGWMFANSPGLNPLQHPIYDAWLIACIAAVPPA